VSFADHFSGHADLYAQARPSYPAELYEHLAALAPATHRAWDCATGNGQAALALAARFMEVVATDASSEQLAHAPSHPRVLFRKARAEACGLEDDSVDLVTVATAAHWFDLDAFYAEARRVGRPRAVLALWTYGARVQVTPEIDALLQQLAGEILRDHWPVQFRHVRDGYRDLPFPFPRLAEPPFAAAARWDLGGLVGFVRSWSGYQRYVAAEGTEPLAPLEGALRTAWCAHGTVDTAREVRLPLALRVGVLR
jgi:SAM-dependent methyltransferase